MTGRTYLLRGERVKVLARWLDPDPQLWCQDCGLVGHTEYDVSGSCPAVAGSPFHFAVIRRGAVRNVLLEFEDGRRTVRPFRGLRRAPDTSVQCPTMSVRGGAPSC